MVHNDSRTLPHELRQCGVSVAGASGMSVGARAGVPWRGCEDAPSGNGDGSIGWSSRRERGGCLYGGGGDARWRGFGVMWKVETVMVMMWRRRRREEEGADRWSVEDLMENCRVGSACGCHVRAGISCGGCAEVISNADLQNALDLVIERNVTDICGLGNVVTVSCYVILKYTNAGRELHTEALADADSLQQNIRRPFVLIQIVESRVDQDRWVSLYDPKFYSATFKKQVGDRSGRCGTSFYSSG